MARAWLMVNFTLPAQELRTGAAPAGEFSQEYTAAVVRDTAERFSRILEACVGSWASMAAEPRRTACSWTNPGRSWRVRVREHPIPQVSAWKYRWLRSRKRQKTRCERPEDPRRMWRIWWRASRAPESRACAGPCNRDCSRDFRTRRFLSRAILCFPSGRREKFPVLW